jgi:hypothetical protein
MMLSLAALSNSVFTGISRNHLDRLVTELAGPFAAAREGWLHRRRGGRDRRRWPGAGHPETLTLRDQVLVTVAWLRLALPHQAIALWYGVDRTTISAAIRQITPFLANRGFATTIKATIASDAQGRPIWVGATRPGRMHDQTAMRTEGIDELIEQHPEVKFLVDSGYRGLANDHPDQVIAPPLKPRKDAAPEQVATYGATQSPVLPTHPRRTRHRTDQVVAAFTALHRPP